MSTAPIFLKGPTDVVAITQGSSSIEVSWAPSTTQGTISYTVSAVPIGGGATVTAGTSGNTVLLTGLAPATSYKIGVTAQLQGTKRTAKGGTVTGKTQAVKVRLYGASNLKARTLSSSSIQLSWSPSSTPGALYRVLVWQLQSSVYSLLSVPGSTNLAGTSFTVTGLSPGGLFRLQVQASLPGTNQTAMSGTISNVATMRATAPSSSSQLPTASQESSGGFASGNGIGDNTSYQAPTFNGGVPLDEDEN